MNSNDHKRPGRFWRKPRAVHPKTAPHSERALRGITAAAITASTALTGAAFWLSYQHLQELAAHHGLHTSPARSWAWPGTIDLFIVIGELLCLRAAFARAVDRWAVALTAFGGAASIILNVVSVGRNAHPLEYVVAAIPSVAALLGFGVIMQAVHRIISEQLTEQGDTAPDHPAVTPDPAPVTPMDQGDTAPVAQDEPLPDVPVKLLTTAALGIRLGVSRGTIQRWKAEGKITPVEEHPTRGNLYHPDTQAAS